MILTMSIAAAPTVLTEPSHQLSRLHDWMSSFDSALIAYSGGVDSALVLAAAHHVLGDRALGCIGVSPSYPERELNGARSFADSIGAAVRIVHTQEHNNPQYAANPSNRCYFCKSELYTRLGAIAVGEQFAVVLDGTNASDLQPGQHRPGYAAARERSVRSPLAELGFTKDHVRSLAKELNLPVWDKPAAPCLASRVPTGTAIVPGLLSRIEQAEDVLHSLGFRDFRVRHHGDIARLELPPADLPRAVEYHQAITAGVKAAGYKIVTLDLAGFRSGSLHVLSKPGGNSNDEIRNPNQ